MHMLAVHRAICAGLAIRLAHGLLLPDAKPRGCLSLSASCVLTQNAKRVVRLLWLNRVVS
jgi:hypothetical protein